MKKAAPEVRMTEAARKRSAKIRQNKETAENKPGSPKFAPRARVKPMSSSRSGTLEKKQTGSSMSNIEPKKPKIDESIKRKVVREPLKQSTSTLNQRTNNIPMRPASVQTKKMSSITAAKVKEREEKQQMKDHITRLEQDKMALEDRVRQLESKLSKSDILATVVLPNLVVKHDALVHEQFVQQECVAEQLSQITTRYAHEVLQLENRVLEYQHQQRHLENQVRVVSNQLIEQINSTNQQRAISDQQLILIHERDEIISGFERQLEDVTTDNEARIEAQVQELIKPWVEAKAQADSYQMEVEIKNEKNRNLQSHLNVARQSIERLSEQRDHLIMIAHKAEEQDVKINNMASENRQLRDDLETSRLSLSARDAEVQDLSFNLEEEKYRQSIGERPVNTSFRAVYDEENSPESTISQTAIDDVFN